MRRTGAAAVSGALVVVLLAGTAAAGQTPLTLDEAMARARQTAEGRALDAAVGEAEARITSARAGFWPRVDVSESVQRGDQPVFVFGSLLSQRRFTSANFAIPALNHPDPTTNTRTAVTVDQTLFDGGTTRLGAQAARLGRDLAETTREDARQDLAMRAASAFVRVLQVDAAARATDAALAAAMSDRDRARARRDVGLVTDADVLMMDVHVADMRQRQITAAADLTVARLELAEATGMPLTAPIAAVRPAPREAAADVDALTREALPAHPAVRHAGLQQQLADNGRRTARAALWPTVGVQGGWELNGATLGTQRSSWIVGAELRMNLFRGFADSAGMAQADQAHARATAERERVERRVEVGVRAAVAQLAAARAREDAGRAALTQARESQRIIRDRYDNGLATVTDVLRAAEATLAAESRAASAEMDVILQTVALDRALGRLP